MHSLSILQSSILLTQNIYINSPIFNIGGYVCFDFELNVEKFFKSLSAVSSSMDVLQIVRQNLQDHSINEKKNSEEYVLEFLDFSRKENARQICLDWISSEMKKKLDLTNILMKFVILKASDSKYYWAFKVHHLIVDGFAMALFINKVAEVYSHSGNAEIDILPKNPYLDFINFESSYCRSKDYDIDKNFWVHRLQTQNKSMGFETCLEKSKSEDLVASRIGKSFPRAIFEKIQNFCEINKTTAYHYFLANLIVLNYSYGNEKSIIGLPVFNRNNRKFKNTLGPFVNILPFSAAISGEMSFLDFLIVVKNELRSCYRHKRIPLFKLLLELNEKGNLFNNSFSYQKIPLTPKFDKSESKVNYLMGGEQQEDLIVHLIEYSNKCDLQIFFDYKESAFSENVISGLADHYVKLLLSSFNNSTKRIKELFYLENDERRKLLREFGYTRIIKQSNNTLVDLFINRVNLLPQNTAVVFRGNEFSFQEINEISNQLANYLIQVYEVKSEDRVGVFIERSEWLIISFLGILKSSATYIPVDPNLPIDRLNYIENDANLSVKIDDNFIDKFIETKASFGSTLPKIHISCSQLAYIIYTSGSTGIPKGVMIEHRNIINTIKSQVESFNLNAHDNCLQFSSQSFDASIWEILISLFSGSRLVIIEEELKLNPKKFLDFLNDEKISWATLPPAFLKMIGNENLGGIKTLITAGEEAPLEIAKEFSKNGGKYINAYGPTEVSICTTTFNESFSSSLPIGKPIDNTKVYVLNNNLGLIPQGVSGELCIAGNGVARGYLNRVELSAEKFVDNPFVKGERLYRTGDIVKWLEDGNIQFIGRKDDQVKIRGFRVELKEIEHSLLRISAIKQAVVTLKELNNENSIIAYIVCSKQQEKSKIRKELQSWLPDYMIPTCFIHIDKVPLTFNGKIDYKLLPNLEDEEYETGVEYVSPRNEIETRLIEIWKDILKKDKLGIQDNFLENGGHSLKATILISRIKQDFDVNISINDLFQEPTVENLSAMIKSAKWLKKSRKTIVLDDSYEKIIF